MAPACPVGAAPEPIAPLLAPAGSPTSGIWSLAAVPDVDGDATSDARPEFVLYDTGSASLMSLGPLGSTDGFFVR